VYWLATPSLRMEAGASLQEEELAAAEK